jgi:ADP-ribose pyrophosphatase YjhB (NUDIX family)
LSKRSSLRRKSQTTISTRTTTKPSAVDRRKKSAGEIEFIARGCLVHGSRVLLCRSVKHRYLYLPGGHIEFTESAAQALAREFYEECGLRVRVGGLALVSEGVFPTKKRTHHEMNLVFHVERADKFSSSSSNQSLQNTSEMQKIESREKKIAFDWIDLAAISESDVRPLAVKAWLATFGGALANQIEWVSDVP